MTLDASIMLTGALIILLPFLGFPRSWDDMIFFVLGVIVVALGIVVRRRMGNRRAPREFIESAPLRTDARNEKHNEEANEAR